MINKLYDNCFATELSTRVLEVRKDNDLFWHTYKGTIFHKEDGGMANSIGMINGHMVLDPKYEEGRMQHLLDTRLEGVVFMSVNPHERFRKCQIHTAQHLISVVLGNVYKVETLAHHVGDKEDDVEFSFGGFADKMTFELQVLCNGLTRDDLGANIQHPARVEASKMAKGKNLNRDDLHVVRTGILDYDMCSRMHVPSLRYLQMLYVSGYEKIAKGYRIKYLAGGQLFGCVSRRYKMLDEVSHSLAVSYFYVNTGVSRLINETRQLNRDIVVWKQEYYEVSGKELGQSEEDIIIHLFGDIDMKLGAGVAKYVTEDYKEAIVFVARTYDNVHAVVASHRDMDFSSVKVFKEITDAYHLRGGGSVRPSQEGGMYSGEITKFVETHRFS